MNELKKPLAIVLDSCSINFISEGTCPDIHLLPMNIILNGNSNLLTKSFFNNLNVDELYKDIIAKKVTTFTSQSSPKIIFDTFNQLLDKYEHILYLPIAKKVSGQYNQVKNFVRKLPTALQERITLIDTSIGGWFLYDLAKICLKKYQQHEFSLKEMFDEFIPAYTKKHHVFLTLGDFGQIKKSGRFALHLGKWITSTFKIYFTIDCNIFPVCKLIFHRKFTKTFLYVNKVLSKEITGDKKYGILIQKSWLTNPELLKDIKIYFTHPQITEIKIIDLALLLRIHVGINALVYYLYEV